VLTLAAYDEWDQGHVERARNLAQAAMRDGIITPTVNPFAAHIAAVNYEMSAGNRARALEMVDDARAELDTVDDPYARTFTLASIAGFEALAGRIDDARADAERALELARRSGNRNLLANAHHATAHALRRDDPAAALAAAEQCLNLHRESDMAAFVAGSVMALAGGLRGRLGDDPGALELLHDAIVVGRDHGTRPQLAAGLDWALSPLTRTGRPDVAAMLLGGLTRGALAGLANYPGVDAARARTLERVRAVLGDDQTDELVARGAAMSYDELVQYAIDHLDQTRTKRD
jgi:tetratricopeptide (TPR) repeat protein